MRDNDVLVEIEATGEAAQTGFKGLVIGLLIVIPFWVAVIWLFAKAL